jgi:hypothetical protein
VVFAAAEESRVDRFPSGRCEQCRLHRIRGWSVRWALCDPVIGSRLVNLSTERSAPQPDVQWETLRTPLKI